MLSKEYSEIKKAIQASPLEDGMTVSFHHHLRNGDYVLNIVMSVIADLGGLCTNHSGCSFTQG